MSGRQPKNVIGEKYGRLIIIADAPIKGKARRVVTRCECGTEKEMFLTMLRSGDALSCGCYHKEVITTHGQSQDDPLYRVWTNMRSRCNDPNAKYYPEYGGRGIKVCPTWNDYEAFRAWAIADGYREGLTLDRQNNSLGYSPTNCRWVGRTSQQRNRRSQKGSSSQYIGVSFINRSQRWQAGIKVNNKSINLGWFTSELDAAKARDQYIIDNKLNDFTMNNVL